IHRQGSPIVDSPSSGGEKGATVANCQVRNCARATDELENAPASIPAQGQGSRARPTDGNRISYIQPTLSGREGNCSAYVVVEGDYVGAGDNVGSRDCFAQRALSFATKPGIVLV